MSTPNYPEIEFVPFPSGGSLPQVPLPLTLATDATNLTTPDILRQIITHVITADTNLQLPSAADLVSQLEPFTARYVGSAIDFTIITTAGFTTTVVPGSGGTASGGMDVTDSGLFRLIFTSNNPAAYVLIRLSGGTPEFITAPTPFTTVLNSTALSATNMLRGVITHNVSANLNLVLDTATNIITAMGPSTGVGSYFDFTVVATPGFVTTVVPGVGGDPIIGSDTVEGSGRFRVQIKTTGPNSYYLIRLAGNAETVSTVPVVFTTAADVGSLNTAAVFQKHIQYTATSSQNVSLPTAALMVAALGGATIDVGSFVDFTLITTRGYVLTVVPGTGGTAYGSVRVEDSGTFRIIITDPSAGVETYDLVRNDGGDKQLVFVNEPVTTTPTNLATLTAASIVNGSFIYDASANMTAQLPAASTLLAQWDSVEGHPHDVGASFDFIAVATAGYKLTIGTIDPSITPIGSMTVEDSANFRVIFTQITPSVEMTVLRISGGDPNLQLVPAHTTTAVNGPLTAAQMVSQTVKVDQSQNVVLTLASAAAVLAAMGGAGLAVGVGASFEFSVICTEPFFATLQSGSANERLFGSGTVKQSATFKVRITSGTTYDIYRLDQCTDVVNLVPAAVVGPAYVASANELATGVIRYTITADTTLVLPDAADVVADLGLYNSSDTNASIGKCVDFTVHTTRQYRTTVVAGAGGAAIGNMVVTDAATFRLIVKNADLGSEAYDVVRLDSAGVDMLARMPVTPFTIPNVAGANIVSAANFVANRVFNGAAITANRNFTLPAAAAIITALGTTVVAGNAFDFTVVADSAFTVTVIPDATGTLRGPAIVSSTGSFRFLLTNVGAGTEAYEIIRLDAGENLYPLEPTTFTTLADANSVVTGAQIQTKVLIQQSSITADRTLTLDTAANLVTDLEPSVGSAIEFTVIATPQYRATVAVGTGGTMRGSGVVAGSASFKILFTNVTVPAYELIRLSNHTVDEFMRASVSVATVGDADTLLTGTQLVSNQFIQQTPMTADRTLTLPTAALIKAAMNSNVVPDGASFTFTIVTSSPYRSTIAVGAGGTLYGSALVQNTATYRVVITTTGTAYNVIRLDADGVNRERSPTPVFSTAIATGGTLTASSVVNNATIVHTPPGTGAINTLFVPDRASLAAAMGLSVAGASTTFTIVADFGTFTSTLIRPTGGTLYGSGLVKQTGTFKLVLSTLSYDLYRLDDASTIPRPTAASTSGNDTLSTAEVLNGLVLQVCTVEGEPLVHGAINTLTLPSAADLVAAVPEAAVGSSLNLFVLANRGKVKLVAGTSGTIFTYSDPVIDYQTTGQFNIRLTNVTATTEAYDVYRVQATSPLNPLTANPYIGNTSAIDGAGDPIHTLEIAPGAINVNDIIGGVVVLGSAHVGAGTPYIMPGAAALITAIDATYGTLGGSISRVEIGTTIYFSIINAAQNSGGAPLPAAIQAAADGPFLVTPPDCGTLAYGPTYDTVPSGGADNNGSYTARYAIRFTRLSAPKYVLIRL